MGDQDQKSTRDESSMNLAYAGPEGRQPTMMEQMQMQAVYAGPAQMNPKLLTPAEGVYAGPSMMMVYAGPNWKPAENFMMMAYAGPEGRQPTMMEQMQMQAVYAGPAGINGPAVKASDAATGAMNSTFRKGVYCFCPECGAMSEGEKFCRECGTPLKDVKRYKDCPGCKTRLDEGAKFCHECGTKQDNGPKTEETRLA